MEARTWSLGKKAELRAKLDEVAKIMAPAWHHMIMVEFELKVDEKKAAKILEVMKR